MVEVNGVESAPLGTIARKLSTVSTGGFTRQSLSDAMVERRLLRWALQSQARELLPNERVATCLRVPVGATVDVMHEAAHQRAIYRGLQTCSSMWHCPICAAKISERRRVELATATSLSEGRQWPILFATYTFSHHKRMALSESLSAFTRAREAFNQGRAAQAMKVGLDRLGTVSVLEVTWSSLNGWHPHYHELIFCSGQGKLGMDEYGALARANWERVAGRFGLSMNEHGYKLEATRGAIADYIAKYGHEPLNGRAWGAEDEVVKGHLKQGRTTEHYTPFALLAAIFNGADELRPIWQEYARAFKGHKQLNWSRGLKARFGIGEKTDEEVAGEIVEEAVLLGRLTREQWRAVLANDARGEVLERAHGGDWDQVVELLAAIGAL